MVFGEVLREGYVFDSAFTEYDKAATLSVLGLSNEELRRVFGELVAQHGFVLTKRGAINYVGLPDRREAAPELLVYRPKFRTVAYLQGAIRTFLPRGLFAGGGASAGAIASVGVVGPTGKPVAAAAAPGGAGPAQSAVAGIIPGQGAVLASQDVFVFEGPAAEVEKARRLLEQLDVAAGEVLVKAVVFEVATTSADGSAVALALRLTASKLGLSGAAGLVASTLANSATVRLGGIEAVYSALASDSRFKVVTAPSLRVRSGEVAKLSVGSDVPVLGAVTVSASGQPVQSVDYRSSGVILELRPSVLADLVQLGLSQQVSSFVNTTSGVNQSPTLLKREIATSISVRPDEVVMLGGLDEKRESSDSSGLPFLPDWLRSRGSDHRRSELLLLLEVRAL